MKQIAHQRVANPLAGRKLQAIYGRCVHLLDHRIDDADRKMKMQHMKWIRQNSNRVPSQVMELDHASAAIDAVQMAAFAEVLDARAVDEAKLYQIRVIRWDGRGQAAPARAPHFRQDHRRMVDLSNDQAR